MTQKELAAAVSTTYQTIQRWESGESVPRPTAQRKLCEVLGVTPDELLAALAVNIGDSTETDNQESNKK